MERMKVCFAASSGGHLEEIAKLKKIEEKYDGFLVTERSGFEVLDFCERQYFVSQVNRKELLFIPKFIGLFFAARRIIKAEEPDFIITTGALMAFPFCIVGRLHGAKIVYIESFARVEIASLTGKLLYNFADIFIVQWEDMLVRYPKAVLGGGIF